MLIYAMLSCGNHCTTMQVGTFSHTFVPISWMCKKQTSVSHSSTETEIISHDAGSRMDGIPALDLWDLVIEVFHSSPNQKQAHPKSNQDPNPARHS